MSVSISLVDTPNICIVRAIDRSRGGGERERERKRERERERDTHSLIHRVDIKTCVPQKVVITSTPSIFLRAYTRVYDTKNARFLGAQILPKFRMTF